MRQEIEDAIAYNNAKEITVQLYANEGTGSTLPSGNYVAKQGYAFEISFSENPAYSFVKWTAVLRDDSTVEITEGITFEDKTSPVTKVKITNDADPIKIIPVCEKRIEVSGEPSPRYDPLGVSRDRSISVSFTKPLAENCFFFTEEEIPSEAEIKTNAEGKIWAYVYENQTYLKNISITNIDDYSIAQHFTCPEISDRLLTIAVDKTNPIEFNSGEIYKTVKVTLSKDITDTLGIKMNSAKSWNYQITESTDEKATVILGSDKGTVYLAGTRDYSIGQKITLAYTEDADYQFVRWDYDSSIIYVAEPANINTSAIVQEKTTTENPTQIKAVCAPRLRVDGFSPVNDSANPTVCKNSSIVITFSQNLPSGDEGLKQLENISITVGGSPVKSSFKAPAITENTVTFVADNSNMLDVPAGQTKTVSVSVPADFYYKLDDGTKVTYGGNGRTFDYKIDSTTLDKAEVTFTAASGSGELSGASGTNRYSIGQEVAISFTPAAGWKFNRWTITKDGAEIDSSKIAISDKNALSTKLTIYEALQGVIVSADVSERFAVSSTAPAENSSPKDSDIKIVFNKNLAVECASLLDSIRVSVDGNNADSNFATRTLSDATITLMNTKHLSVAKGTVKNVAVTIPSSFYYMDGSRKVTLDSDYSFNFTVGSNSKAKAVVSFKQTPNAGTVSPQNDTTKEYSLDEEVPLSFAAQSGWQFNGWLITKDGLPVDESIIKIEDKKSADTKLIVYQTVENVVVKADASEKLVVNSTTPTSEVNDKDSAITITFNKTLDAACESLKNQIRISMDGVNVDSYFTDRTLADNKITIKNTGVLNVGDNEKKTITVTVPKEMYYIDTANSVQVNLDRDYSFSYVVNSTTNSKTSISYELQKSNSGSINQGAAKDYNLGSVVNLVFTPNDAYQFNGWEIRDANGVEPADSLIKIADKTALSTTLTIYQKAAGISIKAKTSEKLKVSSASPSGTEAKKKDSSIVISFNKPLDSSCSALLNQIRVSMDGVYVDSSFATRNISGSTITLTNTKYLTVTGNETKNITVTVPKEMFYKDTDNNVNVSLEKDYSFSYNVNSQTNNKTDVTFTVEKTGSGTINQTSQSYDIGKSVNLTFAIAEGYQFNGWSITDSSGTDVSEDVITIADKSSVLTTMTVNQYVTGITVKAKASQKLKVNSVSPLSTGTNPKDSSITITFNKELANACSSLLDSIRVTVDGNSVDNNFTTRAILSNQKNTVKLTNTNYLSVADGLQKTVTVTVPSTFYYKDSSVDVSLENDYSFTFVVNSDSTSKANITHAVTANAGTITPTAGLVNYSLDKEIPLTFTPTSGYEFTGWTVTTSSGAAVDNSKISIDDASKLSTKLRIYQSVSNVTVKANAYLVPTATTSPVSDGNAAACDTPVKITFNKAINKDTVTFSSTGSIQIMDSDETRHYESYFNTPTWSGNTLTITPRFEIRNLFNDENEIKKLKVKINYKNIKDTEGHVMLTDPSWIYRISYDMEKDPPEVSMTLYKPQYNPTEVSGSYSSIPTGTIIGSTIPSNWAARQIKDKVYFDATATDSGSGYKQLTIKETYSRNVLGSDSTKEYPVTTYTSSSFTKQLYNLKSEMDGIVQLDFIFEDKAGIKNTQTYYVIRDTSLEATVVLTPAAVDFQCERGSFIAEQGRYEGQDVSGRASADFSFYKKLTDIAKGNFEAHIPNSSKMVTETFDFSNSKDSIYNSSYAKFDAIYEVKYGYSETAITNNATKLSQTKYSFSRDATRDCFVRITAYDAVGNTDSIIRVFPKQVSIVNMPLISSSSSTYYNLDVSNMDYLKSLASSNSALSAELLFVYKFKPKGSNSFSSDVKFAPPYQGHPTNSNPFTSLGTYFYCSNESFTDTTLTPDGTYYIYVIPYLRYSERNYYGAASEPFIFYHNVTAPSSTTTPNFGSYTASMSSAVTSAGVRNVTVTTSFTKTSGFTYGVRYNKVGGTDYKYADFNFTVPSGASYELYLYAKNNTTNEVNVGTTKKTIDATYDNIPPVVYGASGNTITVSSNQIITQNVYPYDTSGLITDANTGLKKFNYYLIKKNDENQYSKIERSDLEGLTPYVATFSSDNIIQFDFSGFIEGTYILVFDLEDIEGNKGLYSYTINNHVVPGIQKMSYSDSSWALSGISSLGGYNLNSQVEYVLIDGKWKFYSRNPFYSTPSDNTFVRAFKVGSKTSVNGASGYSLSCFISTEYMRKWRSNSNKIPPECKSKAMLPAYGNAFVLYYDAPCLVHTMIFPTERVSDFEYTITKTMSLDSVDRDTAAAAVWASRGMERGLKLINTEWYDEIKTSTYSAPLDEIPAGYSYVVVTHFADGTTAMSDVRQK